MHSSGGYPHPWIGWGPGPGQGCQDQGASQGWVRAGYGLCQGSG